jgi:XapX domain-containing protein
MKTYCVSLAVGVLVGVIYALLQVRSPAPPIVALVGLLGMVLGEQVPSLIQQAWVKEGSHRFSMQAEVRPRAPVEPTQPAPRFPSGRDHTSPDANGDEK